MSFFFPASFKSEVAKEAFLSAAYIKAVTRNFHVVDSGGPCGQKCYEHLRPPAVTLTSAHVSICFESKQAVLHHKKSFEFIQREKVRI